MIIWFWSSIWVWGHVADTTSVSGSQSDESFLSPSCSPWVLNNPVSSVSSSQSNTVVKSVWTVAENSAWVSWPVGGINGNWNNSVGNGRSQCVAVPDLSVSGNFEVSSVHLAGLFDSFVGIFILVNDTFVFNIFEGVCHKTSVASHVSIWSWAVNQLLFREVLESSSVLAKPFKTSGGGEGPAWSTLSLILNWGDVALSNPIGIFKSNIKFWVSVHGWFWDNEAQVCLDEFFVGEGGELVNSHWVGSVFVEVVGLDLFEVF